MSSGRPTARAGSIKVRGVTALDRVTQQGHYGLGTNPPLAGDQHGHRPPPRHHRRRGLRFGAANIAGSRTGCLHGYAMTRLAASLLSLSITLALSPALAAPPGDAPTFDPQRLSEMVKTLSSDAFEGRGPATAGEKKTIDYVRSEEHTSELQSLMRISYAVFCLKKKK